MKLFCSVKIRLIPCSFLFADYGCFSSVSFWSSGLTTLIVKEKDLRINELEKDLRKYYSNEILFDQVVEEIKINYNDLEKISFAKEYITNFDKIDTLSVISVKWNPQTKTKSRKEQEVKLQKWMQTRLKIKVIEVRQLK